MKILSNIGYFLGLLVATLVAYGVGHELGEWYTDVLKSSGGYVNAKDIVSLRYSGESAATLVFIVGIWLKIDKSERS